MDVNTSHYLKFIKRGLSLAKTIPAYFSKFSNKIFTNKQHLVMLVLKQKLNITYRNLIEWLKVAPDICSLLGLRRIPHHTTLVKFGKKLNTKLFSLLFGIKQASMVAIDSTGFETEAKSYYYRTVQDSNKIAKRKGFAKLSIAVDAKKQTIMSYNIRRKLRHDNIDFRKLLADLKVDYVLADKGYDSRENRKFVFTKLIAIPQIPFRKISGRDGYYQSKAAKLFSDKLYHQRSKVETVFSVMKRKYGSVLRARSFAAQQVELICKLIAYNVDRLSTSFCLLIEGFSRAAF